jgi:hypothetical protein
MTVQVMADRLTLHVMRGEEDAIEALLSVVHERLTDAVRTADYTAAESLSKCAAALKEALTERGIK